MGAEYYQLGGQFSLQLSVLPERHQYLEWPFSNSYRNVLIWGEGERERMIEYDKSRQIPIKTEAVTRILRYYQKPSPTDSGRVYGKWKLSR